MQEMDAKRSTKLPQRESAEENDRADTLSDACQVGDTDGDVPVTQSTLTKSTEAPEADQEAPLVSLGKRELISTRVDYFYITSLSLLA